MSLDTVSGLSSVLDSGHDSVIFVLTSTLCVAGPGTDGHLVLVLVKDMSGSKPGSGLGSGGILTLLGPLKTQMVELMGHPPLLSAQGFLGTQILPSPW